MMEEDFYATVKLKSGEEIFAKVGYSEEEDRTFLLLDNPITIERIKTRSTSGYKVEPWIKTSKDELFVINIEFRSFSSNHNSCRTHFYTLYYVLIIASNTIVDKVSI